MASGDLEDDISEIAATVMAVDPSAFVDMGSETVERLSRTLYLSYCRWGGVGSEGDRTPDAGFLETLRSANRVKASAPWAGVIVDLDASGAVLVDQSGRSRPSACGDIVCPSGPLQIGQQVAVHRPRERMSGPLGHYFVLGRPVSAYATNQQARFYFNLDAGSAPAFVRWASDELDRRRLPFEAKVPADPQGYARADAAVIYVDHDNASILGDLLEASRDRLAGLLREQTPMFTLRLARGIAFAETPRELGSFGLHRCTVIAEAFVHGAAPNDQAEAADRIGRAFAAAGIDRSQPWRSPGTSYPYRLRQWA